MNKQLLEMTNQMGKIMVSYALEDETDIDTIAFKMLRNDCPPFVAGFSTVEINGKVTLRYDVGSMISLAYYSAKLSKSEFAAVWSNLLAPLMQCKDWLLGYNSFCFDPQFVFIDRNTMAVKYLYLPLNSAIVDDDDIKAMFMGMMERCELVDGQDLQVELYKLFAQRSFALGELNSIIMRHMSGLGTAIPVTAAVTMLPPPVAASVAPPPPPIAAPPPPVAAYVPVAAPPPPATWQPKESKLTPEEELEQQLMGKMGGKPAKTPKPPKPEKIKPEKKPLFTFGKKQDKAAVSQPTVVAVHTQTATPAPQQPRSAYPAQSMVAQIEDNNTVMLDEVGTMSGGCGLRLANNNAPADLPRSFTLDLSRGGVSIGRHDASKGTRQCDIEFPVSVKSVSRIHARIERQGAGCVLVDLGSVNGTLLNGSRISANVPAPLKSGDCIGFSDKGIDYIFTI